ncbi:MAG: hypothetical protein F4106_08690 [Gemmatimonadetes bacterium]|nr:hypothetical protein [Gemmatimonadota bacterium]MYJ18106.1 hypothetical protein [Gemmatimonadota bacterium]
MSSNFRLSVVNLLQGMCRGTPGVSGALRGMGYRDVWINSGLTWDGQDRSHPVFALASRETRHTLFVEVTGGPEIDPGRLERYTRLTAVELRQGTRLSREQTETYGVAVIGQHDHRETLRECVAESGVRPALILKTADGLVLDANPFVKAALTNIFRPLLPVDWQTVPLSWIPFDHESGSVEIAGVIVPEVVRRLLHGESGIEVDDVCRRQVLWSLTTDTGRRKLRQRIREVLEDAASGEMRRYFVLRGDVIEAAAPEDGNPEAGEGKSPVNPRTLRIASIRFARLMARLRETEQPDPVSDTPVDQLDEPLDGGDPDSSSASTRASSEGS